MIRAGLLTVVVALAGAQATWAAPARTVTMGASNPSVEFDGGPIYSFNAIPGEPTQYAGRDETLIKVETPGRLEAVTTSDGLPTSEIDLQLFKSDADGAHGSQVTKGTNDGPQESLRTRVNAGYYLLSASGYPAVTTTYKGALKLTVDAPPPAVVVPTVPPVLPPQTKPVAKRTLTCAQRARRIKSAKKRRAALRRCSKTRRKHR